MFPVSLVEMVMMTRNVYLLSLCLISSFISLSQQDQSDDWEDKPQLYISGFLDVFYVYDFNQPPGTERQAFLFNHNRHNEFNLNLGLIQLNLDQIKYRAHLGLQTGTYAIDNYSAEPDLLKNIFEANVGISLNKQNNLWLDAGILPSHIGFESAISMDNMTLTRSLLAENSPYFLTGAKLTYQPNEKWELAGLIINGWQRIQRLEGNSLPSFGAKVNYSPSESLSLNWSSFIGTDDPDETRRMRYFNNFYGIYQWSENFSFIAGFDLGTQQIFKDSSDYDIWFSPIIIGQLSISEKWKAAARAEYYQDKAGVIIPTSTQNGFQTTGFSLNLDYLPTSNVSCRLEGRWFNSEDRIFETESSPGNNNFFIGASMAIRFAEALGK